MSEVVFLDDSQLYFIRKWAFSSAALKDVTIPNLVKTVGDYLFQNCENLVSATFLGESFFVDDYFFEKCKKLAIVSFPNAKIVMKEKEPFKDASGDFKLLFNNGMKLI